MEVENVARPTVPDGLPGVGEPPLRVFESGEGNDVVAPRQLSNSLLDDCGIGPGFGEGAHLEQVGAGKTFHLGKSGAQVTGKAVDDFGSPALLSLAGEDVVAELPVESDEFAIDRERGAWLCLMNAGLEVRQSCRIVGWNEVRGHSRVLSVWREFGFRGGRTRRIGRAVRVHRAPHAVRRYCPKRPGAAWPSPADLRGRAGYSR